MPVQTHFTPGPWEYDGEYIWADSIKGYVADPNTDDMKSGKYLPTVKAQTVIEANGRLMAASPEMYEALKVAAKYCYDKTGGCPGVIEAALAKAEMPQQTWQEMNPTSPFENQR